MNINIAKTGSGAVVSLGGSMYVEDSATVREQLIELLEEGIINLTFDLSALSYIDSSGLGVPSLFTKGASRRAAEW